jgi:Uncharacterized protein conserved in bacteria
MDKISLGTLNSYYGGLLTNRQREIVSLYSDRDMTLQEIGEELGTTRQAASDILGRAERKLAGYEKKLGLTEKIKIVAIELENAIEKAEKGKNIVLDLKKILEEAREI